MKTLIALLSLFSAPVLAQQAVGNGGHGVRCTSGSTTSYDSLDLFEARAAALPVDLGAPDLTVDEKLDIALGRLRRLDVAAYERFAPKAHTFMTYVLRLPDAPVTADEGPVSLPSTCELIQVIAQYEPRFPGDLAFVIDEDHWAALDNDAKATLILHETLYHDAIEHGATNSAGVRQFVGQLIASTFATIDLERYLELARAASLVGDKVFDGRGGKYIRAADEQRLYFASADDNALYSLDIASRQSVRISSSLVAYGFAVGNDRIFAFDHSAFPQVELRSYAKDGSGSIDRVAIGGSTFGSIDPVFYRGHVYLPVGIDNSGTIEIWRFTDTLQQGQVVATLTVPYLRGFAVSEAGLIVASDTFSGVSRGRIDIVDHDGTNFRNLVTMDGMMGGLKTVDSVGFFSMIQGEATFPYRIDLMTGVARPVDVTWYNYRTQFQNGRSYVVKYNFIDHGYELWSAKLDDTQKRFIGKLRCAGPGSFALTQQKVYYTCYDDETLRVFHKSVF